MQTINVTNGGPLRAHVQSVTGDGKARHDDSNLELEDDAKAISETGNFILPVGAGKSVNLVDGARVEIKLVGKDETFEHSTKTTTKKSK